MPRGAVGCSWEAAGGGPRKLPRKCSPSKHFSSRREKVVTIIRNETSYLQVQTSRTTYYPFALYLVEVDETDGDPLCGRRILVLSLQGNLLETYVLPREDHYILEICCFDGKLLASYYRKGASDIVGVIALRGL